MIWWILGGIVVLLISHELFFKIGRALGHPWFRLIPQVLTVDLLHGMSVNLLFAVGEGLTTLSKSDARSAQRLTLKKTNLYTAPGSQTMRIGAVPANRTLLEAVAAALGNRYPVTTDSASGELSIEIRAEEDDEMVESIGFLLERCLRELGVNRSDTFVWDYRGPFALRRYWAYAKKHAPVDTQTKE